MCEWRPSFGCSELLCPLQTPVPRLRVVILECLLIRQLQRCRRKERYEINFTMFGCHVDDKYQNDYPALYVIMMLLLDNATRICIIWCFSKTSVPTVCYCHCYDFVDCSYSNVNILGVFGFCPVSLTGRATECRDDGFWDIARHPQCFSSAFQHHFSWFWTLTLMAEMTVEWHSAIVTLTYWLITQHRKLQWVLLTKKFWWVLEVPWKQTEGGRNNLVKIAAMGSNE